MSSGKSSRCADRPNTGSAPVDRNPSSARWTLSAEQPEHPARSERHPDNEADRRHADKCLRHDIQMELFVFGFLAGVIAGVLLCVATLPRNEGPLKKRR